MDGFVNSIDSRLSSLSDYVEADHSDLFFKTQAFAAFNRDLEARGFKKYLLPVKQYEGARAVVADPRGDRTVLVFCLADYLDLARDSRTIDAARSAIAERGTSVSAVPLIAGSTDLHKLLERNLADFVGAEDCVVFPTGQAANSSTIAALCGARDYIVIDKQVHASVLEGVKLSSAKWKTFRHSDATHLESVLTAIRTKGHSRGILVIAEGVYGLDGDVTPLPDIAAVCRRYAARLFLDDAHGTAVLGPNAAGTHDFFQTDCPDVVMGSLSKGLGSVGGWIASTRQVTEYLRFFSGSLVFSVGAAASAVAAAAESLRIVRTDRSLTLRLQENSRYLREGLIGIGVTNAQLSASAIVSARIDDEPTLRDVVKDLYDEGLWVEGLPYPATMRGQERVRLRARASHTKADLNEAIGIVERVFTRHRLCGRKYVTTGFSPDHGPELTEMIVGLVVREADAKGFRLNWTTRDFFKKVINNDEPWTQAVGSNKWFANVVNGQATACVRATMLPLVDGVSIGAVGNVHWLMGEEDTASALVQSACVWLKNAGAMRIVGPLQAPMQVLGAGLLVEDRSDTPFLEPVIDPGLREILTRNGFAPAFRNGYVLRPLGPETTIRIPALPVGVSLRSIRREHLAEDVARIAEAFNSGIGRIPYCSQLLPSSLAGIAVELRELIIPEFWVVAEDENSRVVGFAGGFPDLGGALLEVGGLGDISDVDYLRAAVDGTRRGFLAWASSIVAEPYRGTSAAACSQVLQAMRKRGYTEAWTSWELVDGSCTPIDHGLEAKSVANFEVFSRAVA